MQLSLSNQFAFMIVLLISTITLFEMTDLDIFVQDYFYNFESHRWLVDRNEPILKFFFYSGIKKMLILFAVAILIILIFFRKKPIVKEYQKGLIIVLLSAIFIPAVVGGLKAISNTPCPKNIEHYHGDYPDIKVFESYPEDFKQKCKIRCWPAGHASGGFTLLSLFFLFKSSSNRKKAVIFALTIGWSMGVYKMLIGDHFLDHTIITMLLAWIIILIIESSCSLLYNRQLNTLDNIC